jgi:hypothetical protein
MDGPIRRKTSNLAKANFENENAKVDDVRKKAPKGLAIPLGA